MKKFCLLQYNRFKIIWLLFGSGCFLLFYNQSFSQTSCLNPITNHCFNTTPPGTSQFIQVPFPNNVDFEFDNLSEYVRGITLSGSTTLKLKIDEQTATCRWKLIMYIVNNGAAGNDWHGTPYNPLSAGNIPDIDLLQVKVYNSCRTSPINAIYQTFPNILTSIDIINNIGYIYSTGVCNGTQEVNTAGSYITDYGEYTFIIDYFIKPSLNLNLKPGNYDITLKFCLVED